MQFKNLKLGLCFLFFGIQFSFALPTTNKNVSTEVNQKIISTNKITSKNQKAKKGFFKRIGQNFVVKRMKKMLNKHFGATLANNNTSNVSWSTDIANADDKSLKDAKLIGFLLGLFLGLLGVLGIAIFWKKGERKKAALKGALIGVLALLAILLLIAVL